MTSLAVCALTIFENSLVVGETTKDKPGISGKLLFPGGHVELGEVPEHAIRREIKEETNLDVSYLSRLGFYEVDLGSHYTFLIYLATVHGHLQEGDDFQKIGLLSYSNIEHELREGRFTATSEAIFEYLDVPLTLKNYLLP